MRSAPRGAGALVALAVALATAFIAVMPAVGLDGVPPVIGPLTDVVAREGEPLAVAGAFADADADSWSGTVDYGDGSEPQTLALTDRSFSLRHIYADEGSFPVTVTISDGTATVSRSFTATVENVAPDFGDCMLSPMFVGVGEPVTVCAPYTDPGVLDRHDWWILWGDLNESAPCDDVNGCGTIMCTHAYKTPGLYQVMVYVADKDGGFTTHQFPEWIVVHDTAGRYVAGRGTFESPVGALRASPASQGEAELEFCVRSPKGAAPSGELRFRFPDGGLNLKAASFDSLSFSSGKAQVKGTGTVNGTGSYTFILTMCDRTATGQPDTVRMKITDRRAPGGIVYDNQLGASDSANPTSPMTSGDIIVHR